MYKRREIINLTKHVQDLYAKYYTMLMKSNRRSKKMERVTVIMNQRLKIVKK